MIPETNERNLVAASAHDLQEQRVIPLLEEQLDVHTREVVTGSLRLTKSAEERVEVVEVPLTEMTWQMERVPVDREITERPPVRTEGATTIYPIVEERLVITKVLVLREEIRLTPHAETVVERSEHTLRREVLQQEHIRPQTKDGTGN